MHVVVILCLCVSLLAGLAIAGDEPAANPVERALEKPPATGLLVTFVGSGSQAQEQGIEVGDVIVSYGGTEVPTRAVLMEAMKAAEGQESVPCVLARGAGRITVDLAPGRIGVNLAAVVKGQAPDPLPAATVERLDFAALKKEAREVWYAFSLDGKTKVGFEHGRIHYADGLLHLRHEVAFAGGEQWGINHQVVDATVRIQRGSFPMFECERTRYENALNGWVGIGERNQDPGGTPLWKVTWPPQVAGGEPHVRAVSMPTDLPIVPSYLVEALASLMPKEPKACFHFRPLNEGMGTVDLPAALYVVGEEEIERDGAKTTTWKLEQRKLGSGTTATYWVGADGKTLRIHYGGAWTNAATKDAALKDLPEGVSPKTVDK